MTRLWRFRDFSGGLRQSMGVVILDASYAGERLPFFRDDDGQMHSAMGVVEVPYAGGILPRYRNAHRDSVKAMGVVIIDDDYDGSSLPMYTDADGQSHSAMGVTLITEDYEGDLLPSYRDATGKSRHALGVVSLELETGEPVGGGGGGPYVGPLDLVSSGIAFAHSLRAMTAGSTANAVTIRRSGDDATATFAFVDNTVDAAAVQSFIGGGNGFFTKIFDQSGNVIDVLQATADRQPQWAESVTNSKPGFALNGSQAMYSAALQSVTGGYTCFVCAKETDGVGFGGMAGSNNLASQQFSVASNIVLGGRITGDFFDDAGHHIRARCTTDNTLKLTNFFVLDVAIAAGVQTMYLNGALQTTTNLNATPGAFTAKPVCFGDTDLNLNLPWGGSILEIIRYDGALSDADRLLVRQNIADYYGITLAP